MQLAKCPACRRRLPSDAPITEPCPRCGTDLRALRACLAQAAAWQARARRALAQGDAARALFAAHRAVRYLCQEPTRRTLAAALAFSGRPEAALAVLLARDPQADSPVVTAP